jgi:hypothetical protein
VSLWRGFAWFLPRKISTDHRHHSSTAVRRCRRKQMMRDIQREPPTMRAATFEAEDG